jgi:hypothetical protein
MIEYRVTATLNGEEHTCTLTLPDYYAVSGLDAREAELLIDNTQEPYIEFYGDDADDEDVTGAEWKDLDIEFVGVAE